MDDDIVNLLESVAKDIYKRIDSSNDIERKYVSALAKYISYVCSNFKGYKEVCIFSVENLFPGQLDIAISSFRDKNEIWDLFRIFGTIAWERRFKTGNVSYAGEFDILKLYTVGNAELPHDVVEYIDYVKSKILERHISLDHANIISNANMRISKLKSYSEELDGAFRAWKKELERLEEISTNLRFKLNFVGLTSAYSDLLSSKSFERLYYFVFMVVFFVALILTPVMAPSILERFGYVVSEPVSAGGGSVFINISLRLLSSAPFFLLFLYMFRISLRNFQSVRGQIVQLQIRQAVCQFVEAYSEFVARKINASKDNGDHLKKFEGLIFSGLTPDPDSIPSTFDGLEQIVEALKAIRGNSKS